MERTCDNCKYRDVYYMAPPCDECNFEYQRQPQKGFQNWESDAMTNADRIRSMSDAELANFLDSIVQDWHQGTAQIGDRIIVSWLNWLKGEAEGRE